MGPSKRTEDERIAAEQKKEVKRAERERTKALLASPIGQARTASEAGEHILQADCP